MQIIDKIEFKLIGLFKFILLIGLCIALVAVVILAVRGISSLQAAPAAAPPASPTRQVAVGQDGLMAFLSPPAEAAPAKPVSKTAARLDDMKAAYEKQLSALWSAVQPYQTACGVSPPLTQEQFVEGLRQSSLEGTIAARDAAYAADQIEFVKRSLSNGSVITLCKVGKSGIFFAILEYHRRTWDQLRRESKQAEDAEQRRIEEFRRSEFARVAEEHAGGYRWLTLAGIGFASFMSLALVLIFARIESNLRGLKIQR